MGKEIKVGEIFNSNNYGDFEIIEELSQRAKGRHKLFNIRFIETNGIRYNISSSDIRSGKIKDYINQMYVMLDILGVQIAKI